MARILVCDLCATQEGDKLQVGHVADFDLCASCAFTVLDRFAADPEIRQVFAQLIGHEGQERSEAKPAAPLTPPVPKMTDEATAKQRRAILFGQYGQDIFAITPTVDVKASDRIRYGQENAMVEVLEPVPGAPGKWFARVLEK